MDLTAAATTTSAAPPAASAPTAAPSQASMANGAGAVSAGPPQWYNEFKNEELKGYVSKKGFQTTEALAESYKNLEAKLSTRVPDDKMIVLPEKMEGEALRAIYEKLGAPKDAKEYGLNAETIKDAMFVEWGEDAFMKASLTKDQVNALTKTYTEFSQAQQQKQSDLRKNQILQSDEKLKGEWGPQYEANVNLAKQGAKILGLDAKTLDILESLQGREALFKNLQRIGVGVGESNFVDGTSAAPTQKTAEQAQAEIKELLQDRKFVKQVNKGDREALAKWNELNKLAAPGEKQIG